MKFNPRIIFLKNKINLQTLRYLTWEDDLLACHQFSVLREKMFWNISFLNGSTQQVARTLLTDRK